MLNAIHGYQPKPQPLSVFYEGTLTANARTVLTNAGNSTSAIRHILLSAAANANLKIWREQYNPARNYTHATNFLTTFVVGTFDGRIYQSNDTGQTWTLRFTHPSGSPVKALVSDPDYESLWVGFSDGTLYKATGDSLATWTLMYTAPAGIEALGVYLDIDAVVVATTGGASVYVSSDAGANFSAVALPTAASTPKSIAKTNSGFFLSGHTTCYTTADGGASWTNRTGAMPAGKTFKTCAGNGAIVCAAGSNHVSRSTNEGATWSVVDTTTMTHYSMATRSGDTLWLAGGVAGQLLVSTDYGATWSLHATDLDDFVVGAASQGDDENLWIAVSQSNIARSTDKLVSFMGGISDAPWNLHIAANNPTFIPLLYLVEQNTSIIAQADQDLFALLLT